MAPLSTNAAHAAILGTGVHPCLSCRAGNSCTIPVAAALRRNRATVPAD